jgi:hypothetical protein
LKQATGQRLGVISCRDPTNPCIALQESLNLLPVLVGKGIERHLIKIIVLAVLWYIALSLSNSGF